jgi:hypothetical protein
MVELLDFWVVANLPQVGNDLCVLDFIFSKRS